MAGYSYSIKDKDKREFKNRLSREKSAKQRLLEKALDAKEQRQVTAYKKEIKNLRAHGDDWGTKNDIQQIRHTIKSIGLRALKRPENVELLKEYNKKTNG